MNTSAEQPRHDSESELIVLGTGSAFPRRSYNACFIVRTPSMLWLTDAGGGNGIFAELDRAGIRPEQLRHLFVSHTHTDHIFGIVWVLRRIVNLALEGQYEGKVNVYANRQAASALVEICRLTFLKSYFDRLMEVMVLHVVAPGDRMRIADAEVRFFDAGSENVEQTGYEMTLPSGKTFVSLGDEALTPKNAPEADGADYLLCGAFCRYADRNRFKPYEKHHLTVIDVARLASTIHIGCLMIFHSEDLTDRKTELYEAEAREAFSGRVVVPADGDRIPLD